MRQDRTVPKVAVEPLSEARWARIERGLFDQLDREARPSAPSLASQSPRPWRWRAAAALVVAGAAAAAIGALTTRSLWHDHAMASPSRIVTGGSESHVALGEAALDVGADSALLVSGDDDHGVLVVLDRGKVECEVAPRKNRPPFVVQAGDMRVRVVGTHFSVSRPDGGARVEVTKGVVEVTSHGEVFSVHAGERWPAATSATPAPAPAPEATANAAAENDAPSAPAATNAANAANAPSRARPHAPRRAPAKGASPLADDPFAAPTSAVQSAPSPAPAPAPQPAAPSVATAPAPQGPTSQGPSAQERYEAAAKLEASDSAGALAIYRGLSTGSGPWAANALFAAGRLQADRGQRADAARLLRDYLTRFPHGPNAGDARDLLDRMR